MTLKMLPRRARVLISHQGCIPIYRKGLFDRLAKISDIEYIIAYGLPPRGTGYLVLPPPHEFSTIHTVNYEISIGKRSIIWQPLCVKFWRKYDAAILGDEAKYLSHFAIIAIARMLRRPVVLWGFGYRPGGNLIESGGYSSKLISRIGNAIREYRSKWVDGYFAYTQTGADALVAQGFPAARVVAIHNTVDIEYQRSLQDRLSGETEMESRGRLGLPEDGVVLVYFGRFLPEKRIDLLIEYISYCEAKGRNVWAVIFGAGPEEVELRRVAKDQKKISFRSHDDDDLTRALRIAAAVVVPEYVGLAVSHAFAHGVPLITRQGRHGPELTYLLHGENGLLLPPGKEAFFQGLDDYLMDQSLQARLRGGAKLAADQLSAGAMATKFDGLIRRLLGRQSISCQNTAEHDGN